MCGRATLAMVVSREFITVASMTEMVIGHLAALPVRAMFMACLWAMLPAAL
jgi:hypothetical protein